MIYAGLGTAKEGDEDFENCSKCWIYEYFYLDGDVNVIDHCHIVS